MCNKFILFVGYLQFIMEKKKLAPEFRYYMFYKPYDVLNQFTKERPEHRTLADYLKVEKDVYPVGRLDKDSEGLVLLTNNARLNALLLSPAQKHNRTYLVQVDGDITPQAVAALQKGVEIKLDSGPYKTLPCSVKKLSKAPALPERNPPIRYRKLIPTSWIKIELKEGKNRQIRKMLAKVGFPVLRLVRVQIEELKLGTLPPGQYQSLDETSVLTLLKISAEALNKPKKSVTKKIEPSKSKKIENSKHFSKNKPTKAPVSRRKKS
jgi:23S rRNA pseudouridine2457 synthase